MFRVFRIQSLLPRTLSPLFANPSASPKHWDRPAPRDCNGRFASVAISEPLTISPALKEKLSPARLSRLQRLYEDSRSPFLCEFGEVRSPEEVVVLVEKYGEEINPLGLSYALDAIFAFLRDQGRSPERLRELVNSVGMQKLWKVFRKKVRSFQPQELIGALKLLTFMGTPGNDVNLQLVLRLLTKQANQIDASDLVYLQFLLNRISPEMKSPLSTALEMAVPVVFESQIMAKERSGELGQEDLEQLCTYLHFCIRNRVGEEPVRCLLQEIEKRAYSLSPKLAQSVIWSLCDLKHNDPSQASLIRTCFNVIAKNVDSFDLPVLSTTLQKASWKFSVKKLDIFYNEDFLHAFCNKVLAMGRPNKAGQKMGPVFSLKNISMLRYVHVDYVDYVGEIVASNPSEILNNDHLFSSFVKSLSGFNYKPDNWKKFEAMLLNHPSLSKDIGPQEISLAADFLALETFPEILIERIFSAEGIPRLEEFVQKYPSHSAFILLLILNAVQTLYPQYSGSLPPLSMINKWKELVRNEDFQRPNPQIKAALHTGFGGENYVLQGLHQNGLFIDFAILMRKGGYPVAFTSGASVPSEISDIQKPPESEIVLIKLFRKEAFCNNTPRLRGIHALEQRILSQSSHPFIPVDVERWNQLPDFEKIPFLMHKVREKIDKFQWNQSGSDVIPR